MNDPATEELLDVIVRFGWQLAIALYLIFRPNCWAIDVALRESRSKLTHKQLARQIWIPLLLLCLCFLLLLLQVQMLLCCRILLKMLQLMLLSK